MLNEGNHFFVTLDLYGDGDDIGLYAFNEEQLDEKEVIQLVTNYQSQSLEEEQDANGNWVAQTCGVTFHEWVKQQGYDCNYITHTHIKPKEEGSSQYQSENHSQLSRLITA